jgi:hypothetical protein
MRTDPGLEIFSHVAPLGLRFHDVANGEPVFDRLKVTAVTSDSRETNLKSVAVANRSGVFVLLNVRGLEQFKQTEINDEFWQKNPPNKTYRIEVSDLDFRFQPVQFSLKLPVKGIYQWEISQTSPPTKNSNSIPLYSSPTRKTASGMSVIRAEMHDPNGKPAAWAVLEARLNGKLIARGFADKTGKIALIFPTPAPLNNSLASPPEPSGKIPLANQKWDLTLTVKYSPATFTTSPFQSKKSELPDLRLLLAQSSGKIWADESQTKELDTVTLSFNKELILRSSRAGILSPMPDSISDYSSFLIVSPAI